MKGVCYIYVKSHGVKFAKRSLKNSGKNVWMLYCFIKNIVHQKPHQNKFILK